MKMLSDMGSIPIISTMDEKEALCLFFRVHFRAHSSAEHKKVIQLNKQLKYRQTARIN